jgi:hypothetical protein
MIARILALIGSIVTIGFGVWHFFVPRAYKWYGYIQTEVTELVRAVRAINVFFSLSLVLLGGLTIVFGFAKQSTSFAFKAMLIVMCILWLTRVALQIVSPQGSMNIALQWGMLAAFTCASLLFLAALILA